MSYILEALKKSQQERELGEVPTLADAPYPAAGKAGRGAYWSIVAVALAMLATLIALYAAFGERLLSAGGSSPSMAEATGETTPESRPAVPIPVPAVTAPEVAASVSGGTRSGQPPQPYQAPATPAATAAASDGERRPEQRQKPAPAPVKAAKTAAPPRRTAATGPAVAATPAPGRQLPPSPPKVPPELLREVRRFEEQLRQQKPLDDRRTTDPARTAAPPGPPPAPGAAEPEPAPVEEPARRVQAPPAPPPAGMVPPRRSDLPEALQQAIPELRLTVHVYSAAPEQRFVIINSRKMREGDRSREDLRLEEVTPDGVILEYRGQRFFHHR